METKVLHAWIIHKQDSGETSVKLTLFTAECGLVYCLYKGGRTAKKQALLQLFTPIWLLVKIYPNCIYAQRIEHEAAALPLKSEALISGFYINELLYRSLRPDVLYKPVFEAYLTTLTGLTTAEKRQDIETLLRRFEWILIQTSGYALSLTEEAQTGRRIIEENQYQFVEGFGLIQASQGIFGFHILAMSRDDLSDLETLKAAKYLMRKAINYLLEGAEIKTRNLYNQSF